MTTVTHAPLSPFIGLPVGHRIASFRRFTVSEYHTLIELGILGEDDDLELIDGHLVKKMSRNAPHDGTLGKVWKRLFRVLPPGWDTRPQMGLTLTGSEPEPDVVIARDDPNGYTTRHPVAADAGLVIEVADSSLRDDRTYKMSMYGHAGIAEYWIVNLVDFQIEVYTQPTGPTAAPGYAARTDFTPGQAIPLTLDGQLVANVPVADLLP